MGYQRFQGQLLFLTALKSNYLKVIASIINLKRIILNYDKQYYDYPWPKIYSFTDKNFQIKSEGVVINNEIIFFKSKEMCMYSNSPCTNYYDINPNFKKKLGYKIFYN